MQLPDLDTQKFFGFFSILISLILALAGGLTKGDVEQPPTSFTSTPNNIEETKEKLFDQINDHRAKNGLAPWTRDETLTQSAQEWSEHLAKSGKFEHDDIKRGIESIHYSSSTPNNAVNNWKKSAGHNTNMLSNTTRAGLGIAYGKDSKGGSGYKVVLRAE